MAVLEWIREKLGIGAVVGHDKVGNSHRFIVRDEQGLLKIIELFNGKFQMKKKREQFEDFVGNFNKAFGHNIQVKPSEDMINLNRG